MADSVFKTILFFLPLFLPLIFSCYLIFKRLTLSLINKNVLKYGLIFSCILALLLELINVTMGQERTLYLIADFIFLIISIVSALYFKYKKQFMFTNLRYNIFLSLYIFITNLFIYSSNLVTSAIVWVLSGILIYIFSYFDIFKTNADYNPNRFYRIILTGDFCLIACVFILIRYCVISDNYSYLINFEDINSIVSYVTGNSDFEYLILPVLFIIALFSRSFIFPFSCFFSFLAQASNLFYIVLFSTLNPLYSLILFLKTDLFDEISFYFKIYLLSTVVITLFLALFEKHFKILFGYLLSIINTLFIIGYFYNPALALIVYVIWYIFLFISISLLFIQDKLSFKRRPINIKTGFLQERFFIFLFEKLPLKIASVIDFIEFIIKKIAAFLFYLFDIISYYYMRFIQQRSIFSIIKGVLIVFALFSLLAIFIALFGNFGEMQS